MIAKLKLLILKFFQKVVFRKTLSSTKAWSISPHIYMKFISLFRALKSNHNALPKRLRSMILLHVSKKYRCAFCTDLNQCMIKSEFKNEISASDQSLSFSKLTRKESAALDYVDAVLFEHNELKKQREVIKEYFNEKQVVDLTALATFQSMSCLFNIALNVPSDELYTNK